MTVRARDCTDTTSMQELFLGQTVVVSRSDIIFCVLIYANQLLGAVRVDLVLLPHPTFHTGLVDKVYAKAGQGC